MALKYYKPITPSLRFASTQKNEGLSKNKPNKKLLVSIKHSGGRNNQGKKTSPRRGGGSKTKYRIIDFKRDKYGIKAKVVSVEYDPNRTARIALLSYIDGEKRYILAPDGLQENDILMSGEGVEPKVGNCLPLKEIPIGLPVHNIELVKGRGGKIVRSAGTAAQIIAKEEKFAHLKLPSGEVRKIDLGCMATIGQLSNSEHMNVWLGKAGKNVWRGKRPRVRAVVMNPVDHPMGGGEGRTSGGRHPCSKKGTPAKGFKTRRKSKSQAHVIKSRHAKKHKR